MSQSEFETRRKARENTRVQADARKSGVILILLLIGWKSGTSFADQSKSKKMQNQSKHNLILMLKWKPPFKAPYSCC